MKTATTYRTPNTVWCGLCARNVIVRKDGTLWRHAAEVGRRGPLCAGSGTPAAFVRVHR